MALLMGSILFWHCSCTPSTDTLPTPTPETVVPVIERLSPASGFALSMDTITGKGFSATAAANSVAFNGVPATVVSALPTRLVVQVPAGATSGPVTVKVGEHTATGPVFTVLAKHTITAISPAHGLPSTIITISGTAFSPVAGDNKVYFNGTPATVTSASTTQLSVVVPPGGTTGKVTVTLNGYSVEGPVFTYDPPDAVMVTTLAGSGILGKADGMGTTASFSFLWDVAADAAGVVYVADGGNNLVRKITTNGMVTTLAGAGSQPAAWGPGTEFYLNTGIAVDANGQYVYVSERFYNRIRKVSPSGVVTTLAGILGSGSTNGTGTGASFDRPVALVVDGQGNVFVADSYNNLIRKITPAGVVTTFAGKLGGGYSDGIGTEAQFWSPTGLAFDAAGNLFVADYGNNRIRKITPAGVVTTVAGRESGGSSDGPAFQAGIGFPYDVAVDSKGNIYVTQDTYHKIRKIAPDAMVSTLAGTGEPGSADGPGKTATFNAPMGLSIDAAGNLYVADGSNYKVRKITIRQ